MVGFRGCVQFYKYTHTHHTKTKEDTHTTRMRFINIHKHLFNTIKRFQQSIDQPSMVAKPARGQLNRDNDSFPGPVRAENLVARDRFGRPVPHIYNTHIYPVMIS